MTKKQKEFSRHYTDKTNPKTYRNAAQSALSAGYSNSFAYARSHELLGNVVIKAQVARQEEEDNQKHEITKERIKADLVDMLNKATDLRLRLQIIDRINQICGFIVNKSESVSKSEIEHKSAQQEEIYNTIRRMQLESVN